MLLSSESDDKNIAKQAELDAPSLSLEEVKKHLGNLKISDSPVPNGNDFS
ncbi:MAG: hypothetical protein R3E08_14585 [Thiotrichaceae bacterium]